jgi:hypothetical protein
MNKNYNKARRRRWPGMKHSNPGGIYATNPKTKMCDHETPKKKKQKNLGLPFVLLSEDKYKMILSELKGSKGAHYWREYNKLYEINGSFNFYNDLTQNSFPEYEKWYF